MDALPRMRLGPVQVLVLAFGEGRFDGRVLAELRRLRDADAVRLVDVAFVAKDADGRVARLEQSELTAAEAAEFGTLAGALVGFGGASNGIAVAGRDVWFIADAIAPGAAAAIVLLEHRWAIPLRGAVEAAPGHTLDDAWVHPRDLAAIGAGGR